MIATANSPRLRLPTIFSIYQAIEEYWRTCGPVQQLGPEPERVFDPLDAFLVHLFLDLLPDVPVLLDLAVESTGGASSVLGLLHPRVQTVVAGSSTKRAGAAPVFEALNEYLCGHDASANLDVQPAEELLACTSLPRGAVILADARALEPAVLANAVGRWCDCQPEAAVLLLGLGTVGVCPALDALVRICPPQQSRRLWLVRELEGALSASKLGVIAAQEHPDAADILFRIQQLHTTNYQFLDLLRAANQTALESANLDQEVMKSHPSAWAVSGELNEWKRQAEQAQAQVRQAQEQAAETSRRLAETQAKEAELRWALEQTGGALARATSQTDQVAQQLETFQQSLAFRAAARLRNYRRWIAPESSWRIRCYQKSVRALRLWRAEGLGSLLRRVARKCLRRGA